MENIWIVAQAGSEEAPARIGSEPVDRAGEATTTVPDKTPGPTGTEPRSPAGGLWNIGFLVLMMAVLMYLMLFRGPRKQQQQHKQMIQSLKKNDKVRTIGGIYGTIMDVKGDEVILKVDEATNTKIRVSTSAIGKNLTQEGKE